MKRIINAAVAIVALAMCCLAHAADKPVKIYSLAGQSNMQGQARVSTLPYMAMSPETKPLYDKHVNTVGVLP